MYKYKAGFVGFGEVNTPIEVVRQKCEDARTLLNENGVELVGVDAITDDEKGEDAGRAIKALKKEEFDFLIVCITGWIPSHTVIRVINEFKEKPMLLWGLGGFTSEGRLKTTAAQAGTTALRKPMEDMGFNFKYVYDFPNSPSKIEEIMDFVKAASAVAKLKRGKVGMMGYRDMRLYGTLHDGVSLRGKIGTEVEFFEMLEIVQRMEDIKQEDIDAVVNKVKAEWVFEKEAKAETLQMGAKVYLALKSKIEEEGYDCISLIDVDGMKKLLKFPPSMVFMLIANEMGKCTIPENDTMGAVTQLVTRYATGQISAYLEFYEFMPDRLLVGVPDYVPKEIIDGPLKVCPTSFGLLSEGILNVSKVKTGKVTLARLGYKGDKYTMHMITGEAVEPRSWEEVGWTPPAPQLPSLEVIPDTCVNDFAQKVMGQHYILTYGDNTGILTDICNILDIEII
jgi:L-fucose isomerase-like protein